MPSNASPVVCFPPCRRSLKVKKAGVNMLNPVGIRRAYSGSTLFVRFLNLVFRIGLFGIVGFQHLVIIVRYIDAGLISVGAVVVVHGPVDQRLPVSGAAGEIAKLVLSC